MTQVLNASSVLVAVGILQPTYAAEIIGLLGTMLRDAGPMPSELEILKFLREREDAGHVIRVLRGDDAPSLYSLTLAGHRYLTPSQRKVRDKFRFYLLRDARKAKLTSPGVGVRRLAGAAPATDDSSPEKGSVANKIGQRVPSGRSYWPRISRQFSSETGSSAPTLGNFPEWLSFRSERQCEIAVGCAPGEFQLDYEGLAACLGVSPKIVSQLANRSSRHYRTFEIGKRGGGVREIASPRVFLKITQSFLSDYIFCNLPVHHAVHSYRIGESTIRNASLHVGQAFVASLDIENFFGSVRQATVASLLESRGFRRREAKLLASICCRDGVLPQGAPTSPTLTNTLLLRFDEEMSLFSAHRGLQYSRYADDITFSGSEREPLEEAIRAASDRLLKAYGLRINAGKTRIASRFSQQRVTGIIVNERALPPRKFRREVRAALHNASKLVVTQEQLAKLRGSVAYLRMFPEMSGSRELADLEVTLGHVADRARPVPSK